MNSRSLDYTILVSTLLLMAIGVMMVYSSSAIFAQDNFGDSLYFLKREVIFTIGGIGLIFLFRAIDYHRYYKLTYPILIFTLGLLLLVFIPGIGHKAGGAQRWIRIAGFGLQPSEITKLSILLFLAYALVKKGEKIAQFKIGFLPLALVTILFSVIVLLQKDLGTAFVILMVSALLLYLGGAKSWYFGVGILTSIPAFYLLVYQVPYRWERVKAYLDPWAHQRDSGFQLIQSYMAFHSGGLTGVGLGQGRQKLFYLPAAHTDFIFANLGEELGLIGTLFVWVLFVVLLIRGIRIALKAPDRYGTFLAAGIISLITIQTLLNLGVVMGLLPTKGLPLPFISHGGTSLLILCVMIGILLNISSQLRKE